jgi:ATP-dependent RNA helicase DDX46/PRP5
MARPRPKTAHASEFLKNAMTTAVAMDHSVETKRKLETLGDMPAVDMTMAEGEASVGDLEVDDDDDKEANRIDQGLKNQTR